MDRTIVGRIATLRGLRATVGTYLSYADHFQRQARDLGGWAPVAIVVLGLLFRQTYRAERRAQRDERIRRLRREKAFLDSALGKWH